MKHIFNILILLCVSFVLTECTTDQKETNKIDFSASKATADGIYAEFKNIIQYHTVEGKFNYESFQNEFVLKVLGSAEVLPKSKEEESEVETLSQQSNTYRFKYVYDELYQAVQSDISTNSNQKIGDFRARIESGKIKANVETIQDLHILTYFFDNIVRDIEAYNYFLAGENGVKVRGDGTGVLCFIKFTVATYYTIKCGKAVGATIAGFGAGIIPGLIGLIGAAYFCANAYDAWRDFYNSCAGGSYEPCFTYECRRARCNPACSWDCKTWTCNCPAYYLCEQRGCIYNYSTNQCDCINCSQSKLQECLDEGCECQNNNCVRCK